MERESRIIKIPGFHAKRLDNYRDIFVYLPKGYDTEIHERYPVLYMHDGQNIFSMSNKSLSGHSWNVDLVVDQLIEQEKIRKIIIVGISNNNSRSGEYTHYACRDKLVKAGALGNYTISSDGLGLLYEDFILSDLKPYIDREYRTLNGPEHTAMIGSSMGGLVTYNIGFRNPEVFGMLGIMSPAFFWEDFNSLSQIKKEPLKIWMDVGEGEDYFIDYTKEIADLLLDKGYCSGRDFMYYQVPWAIHSESDWGSRIFMPLLYFFGDIGKPISAQLFGLDKIGIMGKKQSVNAVVTFDSGFSFSSLEGCYKVTSPEVLEVCKEESIVGHEVGTTDIMFSYQGVKATKQYTVVQEISDQVTIRFHVHVPLNTPKDAEVYLGTYVTAPLKLSKTQEQLYEGSFLFKRGLVVHGKFRREPDVFGKLNFTVEKDRDGKDSELRKFQALEDCDIYYSVENWGDLLS